MKGKNSLFSLPGDLTGSGKSVGTSLELHCSLFSKCSFSHSRFENYANLNLIFSFVIYLLYLLKKVSGHRRNYIALLFRNIPSLILNLRVIRTLFYFSFVIYFIYLFFRQCSTSFAHKEKVSTNIFKFFPSLKYSFSHSRFETYTDLYFIYFILFFASARPQYINKKISTDLFKSFPLSKHKYKQCLDWRVDSL